MTLLVVITTVSKMVAEYKSEPFKISGYLASDVTCVFMAENYEDALLSFQRALALDRGNTEAMTKAAILLTQLGRHSEAENLLKRYAFSVYCLFYDLALFFFLFSIRASVFEYSYCVRELASLVTEG